MGQIQHWVSQAQLRRFLPELTPKGDKSGQLHVYSKVSGYQGQKPIKHLAQEEDAHSADLEAEMSRLESLTAPPLTKLCDATFAAATSNWEVDPKDFSHILDLFALTALRDPRRVSDLREQMSMDAETVKTRFVREMVPDFSAALMQLTWEVLVLPEDSQVLISDAPAILYFPKVIPNVNLRTFALLPLSRSRFLFGWINREMAFRAINIVALANVLIIRSAAAFVYCGIRDDEYVQKLMDYAKTQDEASPATGKRTRKRKGILTQRRR